MKFTTFFLTVILLFGSVLTVYGQERNRTRQKAGQDDARLEALEARIEELERSKAQKEADEELKKLLEAADDLKREKKDTEPDIHRVFHGTERFQPQLNPEISVSGDFFGSYTTSDADAIIDAGDFTDGRNQCSLRDVGFSFVSPLDPFTRGKFLLGIPGAGEDPLSDMIDEAYLEWVNFHGGMNIKIGKIFNQFGILNRYHDHGLPQVDRPYALTALFGTGNVGGFGLSANFLFSQLWAHANELDIEITTMGDGICYDDAADNVIGTAHFKNYWDLNSDTYLEIGFSGSHGYNDKANELETTLAGMDITCKWMPAGRSHYRTTEFRTELFYSRRDDGVDILERFGGYSYLKNKLDARKWIGIRFGYTELPYEVADEYQWDISPTFDYWQSEFVMLRLQYSYTERSREEHDHSVFLQTVWSMGPHKHEAY